MGRRHFKYVLLGQHSSQTEVMDLQGEFNLNIVLRVLSSRQF